jgi:hypothetical protein
MKLLCMHFPPNAHPSVLHPMQRLVSFILLHVLGDKALAILAEYESSTDYPLTSLLTTAEVPFVPFPSSSFLHIFSLSAFLSLRFSV